MLRLLALGLTIAAGFVGYLIARNFVQRRLRFVPAIRSPLAPFVAAAVAWLIASPFALLPLITATAAALFGIGTGIGTASGVKALRRADGW